MSEEENKVLEYFKNNQVFDIEVAFNYIPILLNIIEGLQTKVDTGIEMIKELKELKEIEKSHQEENGKLRVELQQKEQIIKRLEQDVEGYRDLSRQIQEDYSKQIRDYEEGDNE